MKSTFGVRTKDTGHVVVLYVYQWEVTMTGVVSYILLKQQCCEFIGHFKVVLEMGRCCVKFHCGTVLGDEFLPSFLHNFIIVLVLVLRLRQLGEQEALGTRMKQTHSAIRHKARPSLTRQPQISQSHLQFRFPKGEHHKTT